ncbi:MAG: flagellar export chaperone FlgN [Candidatus Hydrogenedentota bacterium]|nr:MAG: flagellar export chaperone FlgN [Candidatus Hydrogenedentota bacterium]
MPILKGKMIMHRAVNDLISMLEREIENYLELKRLMLEKRKAIIENDLKKLSGVTSQIELVIASNNQIEIGRMGLVKKLAAELKLSEPNPKLAHIARQLESPLSEKLMRLQGRAISAIKEVQRQNRMNSEMLKYCANLMDSVLRRLVEPDLREGTYGNRGEVKQRAASASLLDHHV